MRQPWTEDSTPGPVATGVPDISLASGETGRHESPLPSPAEGLRQTAELPTSPWSLEDLVLSVWCLGADNSWLCAGAQVFKEFVQIC